MASMEVNTTQGVLKNIGRHINCLSDDNRSIRKRALIEITRNILHLDEQLSPVVLESVLLKSLLTPYLKLFADPVEKCRELSIHFIKQCMENMDNQYLLLSNVIPVLVQRLGQKDVVETSEELRSQLIELLHKLIIVSPDKYLPPYLDDIITVLQKTICDIYPEVKKESCKTASNLAKAIPSHFHMQSESIIQPLLLSISHQHSRVRVAVIESIGKSYNEFAESNIY